MVSGMYFRGIQLEINNVEDADVEYVHFQDGPPIPRYIDLTED